MNDDDAMSPPPRVRETLPSRVLSVNSDHADRSQPGNRMSRRDDDTISEQARHWLVRLASGGMTGDELAAFETWLGRSDAHARAFADERVFWQRLSALEATFERLEPAADRKAHPTARLPRQPAPHRRRAAVFCVAAAACLLLFLVAPHLAPHLATTLRADYVSGADRTVAVTLPDGSRATLNRNSAIRVDYGDAVRRVELLQGEVFVEVRPNPARPFRVFAGRGVSEAVGTAYAVGRLVRGTRVAVAEGRVAVTGDGEPDRTVSLRAGEGVRYDDGRFVGGKFAMNGDDAIAWRNGKIVFTDRPLADALAELERYHRGRILLLGTGQAYEPISGVIDLDKLDEGIAALAATHGLTIMHLTPYLTVLR
jgi:transmembrane sensor